MKRQHNRKSKGKITDDRGSLIVEATIVFPVTFVIVALLLFVGNLYYQRSKAQAIFTENVIEYAAEQSNPVLEFYKENGSMPKVSSNNEFKPYRYLNFGNVEGKIISETTKKLNAMGTGLFQDMNLKNTKVTVDYKTYGVYAKVEAQMTYSIKMPIKLLGEDEAQTIDFVEYIEVPAMEGSEMVRNVNTVRDILARSETVTKFFDGASKYVSKFQSIAN